MKTEQKLINEIANSENENLMNLFLKYQKERHLQFIELCNCVGLLTIGCIHELGSGQASEICQKLEKIKNELK